MTGLNLYNRYKNRKIDNLPSYLRYHCASIFNVFEEACDKNEVEPANLISFFNVVLIRALNFNTKQSYETYKKVTGDLDIDSFNENDYEKVANDSLPNKRNNELGFDNMCYKFGTFFYTFMKNYMSDFENTDCLIEYMLFLTMFFNNNDLTNRFSNDTYNIINILLQAKQDSYDDDNQTKIIATDSSDVVDIFNYLDNTLLKGIELLSIRISNKDESDPKTSLVFVAVINGVAKPLYLTIVYPDDTYIEEYKAREILANEYKKKYPKLLYCKSADFDFGFLRKNYFINYEYIRRMNLKEDSDYCNELGIWISFSKDDTLELVDPIDFNDYIDELARVKNVKLPDYESLSNKDKVAILNKLMNK